MSDWTTVYDPKLGPKLPQSPSEAIASVLGDAQFAQTDADEWVTVTRPIYYDSPKGKVRYAGDGMFEGADFLESAANLPVTPVYSQGPQVGVDPKQVGYWKKGDIDSDLSRRLKLNFNEAAHVNSAAGAVVAPLANAAAGAAGYDARAAADARSAELRKMDQSFQNLRPWYQADNPVQAAVELLTAIGGTVGGSLVDPSSFLGGPGKNVIQTGIRGGIANAGADIVTQTANILNGVQTEFNPQAEQYNPTSEEYDASVDQQGRVLPAFQARGYDPVQTVVSGLIGAALPVGVEAALNPQARAELRALVSAGVDSLRSRRGVKVDGPPTEEEVAQVMRDPEIQRVLEASGQQNSPRADEFAGRIAARKASEGSRAAPENVSEVSPEAVFAELERQRLLREQGQAGDINAAFVPPNAPRPSPAAIAVDSRGTAVPADIQQNRVLGQPDPGLQRAVERPGPKLLPAPGKAATSPMTDAEVAIASRQMAQAPEETTARLFQGQETVEEPSAPGRLVGRQEAPPMAAGAVQGQREARGAFALADRQRERLAGERPPERVRDTQAAGLERGVEPVKVDLDEGNPVKILRVQKMKDRKEREIDVATVRRYDPRTDEFEADSIEYQVPVSKLEQGSYSPQPRRAQDFTTRAKGPLTPEMPRAAGAAPVRREPAQTYRATAPDPNERFPAAGEGRSPIPPQSERNAPPRYSSAEEAMKDFQARQGANRRSGEYEREARAQARYKEAKASNTPKGQDADKRWHVDEDGYVLSDKGGPIRFKDAKQAANWIVNKGQKESPDQNFELTNHPVSDGLSVRETSRTPHPEEFKGKKGLGDEAPRGGAGERSEESFKKEAGDTGEKAFRPSDETQARGPSKGEVQARQVDRVDDVPAVREEPRGGDERVKTEAEIFAEKFVDEPSATKRESLMESAFGKEDTDAARNLAAAAYREATGEQLSPGKTTVREFKEKFREWADNGKPGSREFKNKWKTMDEARGYTDEQADTAFEFAARMKRAKTEKQFKRLIDTIEYLDGGEVRALGKMLNVEIAKGMSPGAAMAKIREEVSLTNIKDRGPIALYSGPVTPGLVKRVGELLFGGREERARHFAENAKIFGTVAAPKEGLKRLWRGSTSMGRAAFYSADGRVRGAARQLGSKTMEEVADMFHAPAGGKKAVGKTYEEAVQEKVTSTMNELSDVLEPFLSKPDMLDQLTRMVQSGAGDTKSALGKAAAAVRKMLQDELKYLKDAGVGVVMKEGKREDTLGNVRTGYFPREFDDMAVMRDPEGFKKAVTREYRQTGMNSEEATAAADALLDSVLLGGAGEGVFRGGDAGARPAFTAGRVFDKGADARLREFYIQDPVRVLGQYFHRAARRAEAARLFGDKWEKWAKLEHKVREEVGPKDAGHAVDDMRALAMVSTGMRTHKINPRLVNASAWIRAWTGLALLGKVSISSLQELVMPGVRSGSLLDQFKGLAAAGSEAAQMIAGDKSRRIEFAEDLGIIYSNLGQNIHVARFFGDDPGSVFLQKAQRNYFRIVGLEQLTNITRAIAASTAQVFVRRMVKSLNKEWGKMHLRELGIPAEKQAGFAKWLDQWEDGMPDSSALSVKGGKVDENVRMYRTAILRFVNQSVQNPTAATKPAWASHPLGAIAFQLNAFNMAFTKNVLWRAGRRLKEAVTNPELEALERAKLAVGTVAPLLVLSAFGVGISVERDRIYRTKRKESPQDKEEIFEGGPSRGEFVEGIRHLSRISAFGGADPWVNFFTQAKYDKDPVSALSGPAVGAAINLAAIVPKLVWNNSDKTNTTEREAAKLAYDFAIEPGANLMLNTVMPPNLFGAAATQALGSNDVREEFVTTVAGKEKKKEHW